MDEQVHGVAFQPDCLPAATQLVGAYIELEIAKADNWMRIRLRHSWYFGGTEILSCLLATEKLQINFSLSLWSCQGWDVSICSVPAEAGNRRSLMILSGNFKGFVNTSPVEVGY